MSKIPRRAAIVGVAALTLTAAPRPGGPPLDSSHAAPVQRQARPDVRSTTLESAAIGRNLVDEPPDQKVLVFLPPTYDREPNRRFPVIYLLHGVGDDPEIWDRAWNLMDLLDGLMRAGTLAEMIVVMPNGRSQFLGGYYMDSPVTGGWATFIKSELVGWVDSTYRTIAKRESRGVIGLSMGGFGAIQMAMRASDVFSVVYAMSPCCLDFVEDAGYGNIAGWRGALSFRTLADVRAALRQGALYPVALYAFTAATLPSPNRPPLFVEWPVQERDGELLPSPLWDRWRAEAPARQVSRFAANLRSLTALGLEYGIDDQFAHIPPATTAFVQQLAAARIPHRLEVFDGDHRNRFRARMASRVLPFVAEHLTR